MSKRGPTAQQRAAIEARGEILVSASAGSGKTFVMIEKIISLILSGEAEVSSLLAVTFTNLAAEEMKERLKKAVASAVNSETDGARRSFLKAQLSEIGASDICTLHSFCSGVVRRYFYRAGVDANFRIAEEEEAEKLKKRAAEGVFAEQLENGSADFSLLSGLFAGSRGFSKLEALVTEAHARAAESEDFSAFLTGLRAKYTQEGFARLAEEAFEPVRRRARRLVGLARETKEKCDAFALMGVLPEKFSEFCASRILFGEEVLQAENVFACARLVAGAKLPNKPASTRLRENEDREIAALDENFSSFKEEVDGIRKLVAGLGDEGEEFAKFLSSGEVACALANLVSAFDEAYEARKRRAGVLDFSDLERKCLELLRIPEVREEVRSRYDYLFVDEYQDVNPVQEEILSLVAGKNVFMVGDAKQSIYGFRGCSAEFFSRKYARLSKEGRALLLNGNFRSAPGVLAAVNAIFCEAMTEETASVDYRSTSVMQALGGYPEGSGRVRFHFLPEKEAQEKKERDVYSVIEHLGGDPRGENAEGAKIAEIVFSELSKNRFDLATGETVKTQFKDIAVLTRNKTARAERIVDELVRRGIPVTSSAEYNICDYPEVKTMIEILKFIDNAAQDIPLAASLKSAVGGLDDEDLAKIRLYTPDGDFVSACERYGREVSDGLSEKLHKFSAFAEKLRLLAGVRSAAEIMAAVLAETDMQIRLLASPCGEEKLRRVMRLIAESGDLTVPEFLEKLKNGGYRVGFSESGGENAVRVMTMHASKGLEFPVVIVAGMNDRFSAEDMKGDILYDREWGFAMHAYDTETFRSFETLLRSVVKNRLQKKRSEEEMRLLYVALTRAQESLHLIFSSERSFDGEHVAGAACFADFIRFEKFKDLYADAQEGEFSSFAERDLILGAPDEEAAREVRKRYRMPYAHAASLGLPVKTSASELLRERGEPYYPEHELVQSLPAADTETGTAYHAFLELADFSAPPAEACAGALHRLSLQRPDLAARIDENKARSVLSMPVFASLQGFELFREREFLLSLPANEVFGGSAEDEILLQGVIDLMAVKGDRCVILDYKYSSHTKERLSADYALQLKIYAAAARRAGFENAEAYLVNILREEVVRAI